MSLTQSDLQQIRSLFEEYIKPIDGRLQALENDVKEIYQMITEIQQTTVTDVKFKKLSLEKKLLTLNTELLATAKQAGITLPRS